MKSKLTENKKESLTSKRFLEYKKLFGVIGYPIKQSLSPVLHNWGFRCANLNYAYFKWEIEPSKLPEMMVAVDTLNIAGLSVTIPFKEKILPYLDELTEDALCAGAVNHVYRDGDKLIGHNTDIDGFIAPINDLKIKSALILGCGGAACACILGLKKKKVEKIWVAGRKQEKLKSIKKRFGVDVVLWDKRVNIAADMLVNSTPLGMYGHDENSPFPEERLLNFKYVYDIIYNPLETKLLKDAKKKGIKTIGGLSMFIHQALCQFKIWTGKSFEVSKAHELLSSFLK